MKKILAILATMAILFSVAGCSNAMHDGTQMAIGSIEVTGLPASYEGLNLTIRGNAFGWTASGNPGGIVTGGKVTITLPVASITSDPIVEFKLAKDTTWDNELGAAGGNAKLDNTWTGPALIKKIVGTYSSGIIATWKFE